MDKDSQYMYISYYIDSNPLDLILEKKSWKNNKKKALAFFDNYSWSSYRDYFGKESVFSPIINRKLFYELFETDSKIYPKEMLDFLENDSENYVDLPG